MTDTLDSRTAEERFRAVFSHLGAVAAYARRRGNRDADAVAAEVDDDCLATTGRRPAGRPAPVALCDGAESRVGRRPALVTRRDGRAGEPVDAAPAPEVLELDPAARRRVAIALPARPGSPAPRRLGRPHADSSGALSRHQPDGVSRAPPAGAPPACAQSWPGRRTTTASTRTPISRWRPHEQSTDHVAVASGRPGASASGRGRGRPLRADHSSAGRSEAGRTSAAAPAAAPAGCRACLRHAPAGGTAGLDGRRGLAVDRGDLVEPPVTRRSTSMRRSS